VLAAVFLVVFHVLSEHPSLAAVALSPGVATGREGELEKAVDGDLAVGRVKKKIVFARDADQGSQ
jgi:hypothetical protein